ncbi:MAG: hypothetical protein LBS84_07750 [Clostridiales bacterium]|jgi:tripartite-type tricarboxylate transporter receptor subunit TctC|nr:hypothetical protein [Clostridiales bacterium]
MRKYRLLLLPTLLALTSCAGSASNPANPSPSASQNTTAAVTSEAPADQAQAEPKTTEPASEEPTLDWPKKKITILVPAAAGGATDTIARFIAAELEPTLGVSVLVENKGGGGGLTGVRELIARKNDGYTFGYVTNSMVIAPHVNENEDISYSQIDYVCKVNNNAASVTISSSLPYNTLEEFVEAARGKEMTFAHTGANGTWHIVTMQFLKAIGAEATIVPYDGANPAVVAVAGGHVDATCVSLAEAKAMLDAGEVKSLGVMATERSKMYPDIPTLKEQGYDLDLGAYCGLAAPKGTDPQIIAKMDECFKSILESDKYIEFADNNGYTVTYLNHADFLASVQTEDALYKEMFQK